MSGFPLGPAVPRSAEGGSGRSSPYRDGAPGHPEDALWPRRVTEARGSSVSCAWAASSCVLLGQATGGHPCSEGCAWASGTDTAPGGTPRCRAVSLPEKGLLSRGLVSVSLT